MGQFLTDEKPRQARFKTCAPYFSDPARSPGVYKNHLYDYCLPAEYSVENLIPEIRESISAYFDRNEIKWHDAINRNPSNHMCDSQVCCANFLFPFADKPDALAFLLKKEFPDIATMLPVEDDLYVAFEWIGQKNYLRELSRNGKRSRGANYTSADAAMFFKQNDGRRHFVLIEWKYTETYSSTSLKIARSGRDRTEIYAHLFDRSDCILAKDRLPGFESLFYEPFYQFMRQQFLAQEMEKAHELGADLVSLLHIAPDHNKQFRYITSPDLRSVGQSAVEVWKRMLKEPDKFRSVSTEKLFGTFETDGFPELESWRKYIHERYAWISEGV